jgi:hypothetical protein
VDGADLGCLVERGYCALDGLLNLGRIRSVGDGIACSAERLCDERLGRGAARLVDETAPLGLADTLDGRRSSGAGPASRRVWQVRTSG